MNATWLWLLTLLIAPGARANAAGVVVDRAEIDRIVTPVIDRAYAQCIVVGIVDRQGVRVIGYGQLSDTIERAPDGSTVFEIGSITKVFTSLLLADMECEGVVSRDDPVQQFLPNDVKLTERGRAITLLDLSTHQSGLPRMPDNLNPADPTDPFASYGEAQLFDFLRQWKPSRAPGEQVEYSNLGAGLLGELLARRSGASYESLVVQRITTPLNMHDTTVSLSESQRQRLAPGYNVDLAPDRHWHFDALAGAGALCSTADDMLRFIQAQLNPPDGNLGEAIRKTHEPQAKMEAEREIALAWIVDRGGACLWHNGQTGGYHSFVAFSPQQQVGVVLLSNTATGLIDAIGSQIIRMQIGMDPGPAPTLRDSIKLGPEQLDRLVGDYQLGFAILQITRNGDRLMAKLGTQPAFRIWPQSETSFYWRVVEAAVDFRLGDDGKAESLVLHQNGRDMRGARVTPTR